MTDEIDTNAPERIWAVFEQHESNRGHPVVFASAKKTKGQEYVRADLYDAERQRAEKAEAALRELVAECTCHPAYSGRDMQDPECPAGLFGDIACEGLGLPPRCQYNRADLHQDEEGDE